jgi:peptidoglycan-N-acetylglucosamine deacetylase
VSPRRLGVAAAAALFVVAGGAGASASPTFQQLLFFDVGWKADRKPWLVRLEASVGPIGDHSYTHPLLVTLPPTEIRRELRRTQRAIRRAAGRRVRLFRPPFGDNASEILRIARRLGMLEVMWNEDSGDASEPSTPSSQEIYRDLVDRVKAGGIVLMHEDEVVPRTLDALRMFLPVLEHKGLHAVTVPALLQLDPPRLDALAKGSGGCHSSWHPLRS